MFKAESPSPACCYGRDYFPFLLVLVLCFLSFLIIFLLPNSPVFPGFLSIIPTCTLRRTACDYCQILMKLKMKNFNFRGENFSHKKNNWNIFFLILLTLAQCSQYNYNASILVTTLVLMRNMLNMIDHEKFLKINRCCSIPLEWTSQRKIFLRYSVKLHTHFDVFYSTSIWWITTSTFYRLQNAYDSNFFHSTTSSQFFPITDPPYRLQ